MIEVIETLFKLNYSLLGHYSGTVIEAHAATCDGFPEFTPTAGGHSSSSRAYSSLAPRSYSSSTNQNAVSSIHLGIDFESYFFANMFSFYLWLFLLRVEYDKLR